MSDWNSLEGEKQTKSKLVLSQQGGWMAFQNLDNQFRQSDSEQQFLEETIATVFIWPNCGCNNLDSI